MWVLTRLATLILALILLTSCGEGYRIESARLNLIHATQDSKKDLQDFVSNFLAQEGFEDLGRDDEMVALLKRSRGPDAATDPLVADLLRTVTYLNRDRDLSVEITDHSDGSAAGFDVGYTPKTRNFVEIRIYEARPGGASPEGHQFYGRFLGALRARYGSAIVEVNGLPPTDEAEYRRVTRANMIGTATAWCIAFGLTFLVTSALSLILLGRTNLDVLPRRVIFTAANVWLATPVLMPATILVLPMPNALAFPWLYPELYALGGAFNQVSFLCSFIACAAASILLVKGRPRSPAPSPHESG